MSLMLYYLGVGWVGGWLTDSPACLLVVMAGGLVRQGSLAGVWSRVTNAGDAFAP